MSTNYFILNDINAYHRNVTPSTLKEYPTAWVTILNLIIVFTILIFCLPKRNDKPLIAQPRVWSVYQRNNAWKNEWTGKQWDILENESNSSWCKQVFRWWILDLKSQHLVFSMFVRDNGTNYTSSQRAFSALLSIMVCIYLLC